MIVNSFCKTRAGVRREFAVTNSPSAIGIWGEWGSRDISIVRWLDRGDEEHFTIDYSVCGEGDSVECFSWAEVKSFVMDFDGFNDPLIALHIAITLGVCSHELA